MLLLVSACASLECGPGTSEVDGACVVDAREDTAAGPDTETGTGTDTTDSAPDTEPAIIEAYLLAGQSNMDGYGLYTGLPPSWRVGQPDVPLYWSGWAAFGALAPTSAGGAAYTGPEVSFGRTLADAGRDVALVKHAVGGTDLATYWDPGADPGDTDVGAGWAVFAASIEAAAAELDAAGQPWRWAGLAWMQGESDAIDSTWSAAYEANLTHFVARVREETGTPDLPVAIGLIACDGLCAYVDTVRAAQEAVAEADPYVTAFETLDLPRSPADPWHYDGPSTRVLGERFAQVFLGEPPADAPVAALALTGWRTDNDGEFTVGWRFTAARDIVVTDVGGFGETYLLTSQEWGLWDAGSGELLHRGTIPGWYEAPTSWRDGFWYTAVEPFDLPAGDYVVGLVSWSGDGNSYANDAVGAVGEGLAYVEARYAGGYWLTFPSVALGGLDMAFLGPSFLYREAP